MTYTVFRAIEDDSNLAFFFNATMKNLQSLRILCSPTSFRRDKEIMSFQDEKFCDFIRYELWMHDVVYQLRTWCEVIGEYYADYNGTWKYYAASKRLESINKYGSEDVNDFNPDGSVKTGGLTDKDYRPYTIVCDLLPDGRNMAQDTTPDDLRGLCGDLIANSRIDIFSGLKKCLGRKIQAYRPKANGKMRPVTQEEHDLDQVKKQVNAEDGATRIRAIGGGICGIIQMIKACKFNDDNTELLQMVSDASTALLNMDFDALGLVVKKYSDKYVEKCELSTRPKE